MARILFHVQSILGIGHLRRAAALAAAMAARGLDVLVIDGSEAVDGLDWGGAAIERIEAVRAEGGDVGRLVAAASGLAVDDALRARRREAVLAAFARHRPQLVLIEGFPFARRAFRHELQPLLEAAAPHCVIAVSLRDILVEKRDPARVAAVVETVRAFVDAVLVHGDPDLVPLEASFPAAAGLADRLVYTGYVAPPPEPGPPLGADAIVVSCGGGAVGTRLVEAALGAAQAGAGGGRRWRILGGPHLPPALARHALVEPFRADFPRLLVGAALSVSQAGYNTVLDALAAGCRALLVPYSAPGETEQAQRARLLAERGAASLLAEESLAPETLAAAVDAALARPPPPPLSFRRNGAEVSSQVIEALAAIAKTRLISQKDGVDTVLATARGAMAAWRQENG